MHTIEAPQLALNYDPATGYLTDEAAAKLQIRDVFCDRCGVEMETESYAKMLSFGCDPQCDCSDVLGAIVAELSPTNESYDLLNADEVTNRIWYHTTQHADWLENVRVDYGWAEEGLGWFEAHVGTETAAFDRGICEAKIDRLSEDKDQHAFWLYKVRVAKGASIDPVMHDDENRSMGLKDYHVQRYINLWEDPASVSLAVRSSALEIVSKRSVSVGEALNYLSMYNFNAEED